MSAGREAAQAAIRSLKVKPATGVGMEEAAATVRQLENQLASGKALTESQRWVLACCKAKVCDSSFGESEAKRMQALKEQSAARVQAYAARNGLSLEREAAVS